MRTLAALLLCCSWGYTADPPAWVTGAAAGLDKAIDAGDTALAAAADKTWSRLVADRAKLHSRGEIQPLVDALERVQEGAGPTSRAAIWRAAAAICHTRGVAILQRGIQRKGALPAIARAVRESRSRIAHAWFIKRTPLLEGDDKATRKEVESTLRVCLASVNGTQINDASSSTERQLQKELRAALRSPRNGFSDSLVLALAHTPGATARAELLAWRKKQRSTPDQLTIAIIEAIGAAGDPAGVEVLLLYVVGTSGPVLEASLVALSKLPVTTLRKTGKSILRATHKALELEGKGKQRRKYDPARYSAWWSTKIVAPPPKKMPAGVKPLPAGVGVTGVHGLWWAVIDAGPPGIKPPRVSKRTQPRYLGGRPNLAPDEWNSWHRRS